MTTAARSGARSGFQRARSPEQRDERRRAILETADGMLGETVLAEISLREIARRVGCATSNVLLYFETREAVFLELLDAAWSQWIGALDAELPEPAAPVPLEELADAVAGSLARRPRMCLLMSASGPLLEPNVSPETLNRFRAAAHARVAEAAAVLHTRLPDLGEQDVCELVSVMATYTVGLWPLMHPAAPRGAQLGATKDFRTGAARTFAVLVRGLRAAP
ncbi:TetR/AcrR family transcriptional regulator [Streptacidiphilus sp. N1-12]|uniref:TetR/AcrR family transcriptional regulator n=2 Tax=Streptacidiphilus alkalitolerans TaxID=3342712 RepID=A0ABV6VKL8_9ACTN